MQIHELNNFTGTLGSGAYLAIDDGNDTGKISSQDLLAATEARIDNIIAGPAPSAEEIVDARLGADGVTYPSLGDAIRDQVADVKSDIDDINDALYTETNETVNVLATGKYVSPTGVFNSGTNWNLAGKYSLKKGETIVMNAYVTTTVSAIIEYNEVLSARVSYNVLVAGSAPSGSGTLIDYVYTATEDIDVMLGYHKNYVCEIR